MWKYAKIQLNGRSPMMEIMSRCSDKHNLCLAIYNLNENRVDCAAMPPHEVKKLTLSGDTVHSIKCGCNRGGCNFAILAYDMVTGYVYLVDCTPELNAASAVLLCVVSELMGAGVPCHRDEPVNPEDWDEDDEDWDDDDDNPCDDDDDYDPAPEVVRRDARGRFIAKSVHQQYIPKEALQRCASTTTAGQRRFRLGHRRG